MTTSKPHTPRPRTLPPPNEVPPDLEFERALIGFCMRPPAGARALVERLVQEIPVTAVLTDELCDVYQQIAGLVRTGVEPTPAAVAARLDTRAWPYTRVLELQAASPAAGMAPADARLLAETIAEHLTILARRREVQTHLYGGWLAATAEGLEAATPFIERAAAAALGATALADVPSLGELAGRAYSETLEVATARAAGQPPDLLETGLPTLDRYTGGFRIGDMWVIAAYTSLGKTSLALQIAIHVARGTGRGGRVVHFVSAEMAALQIGYKALGAAARIGPAAMWGGNLTADEHARLLRAGESLEGLGVYIDGDSRTLWQIRSRARAIRARHGRLDLLVVDYLQLLETESPGENRQLEVARLSRGLKGLAHELGVPVVALAQLGRSSQGRAEPELRDLRESGAIESDADWVVFIHDPQAAEGQGAVPQDPHDLRQREIIVRKARMGPTFRFGAAWNPDTQTMKDHASIAAEVAERKRVAEAARRTKERADSERVDKLIAVDGEERAGT